MTTATPLPTGARVLLASNGHGEDQVGARIAEALHAVRPDLRLCALPTVGDGRAYAAGPARVIGPRAALPSGGRTVEGVGPFLDDLRAGLVRVTVEQLRQLRRARADATVAIGDVWIQLLGLLPDAGRRAAVQTLVSVRMHRPGLPGRHLLRERFTVAERRLLRAAYPQTFVRDPESARWLQAHGVPQARCVGNPMMDRLEAAPLEEDGSGPRIVLLPGTRGHARRALGAMLAALERLPAVTAVLPWAGDGPVAAPAGWRQDAKPVEGGASATWRRGRATVRIVAPARFAAAIRWAELAIGAAGTAHEQAAGLGVPVIAFACGPLYTPAFLANQRRLLGEAVHAVPDDPVRIAAVVEAWTTAPEERRRRGAVGRERMGPPGGAARIADALATGALPDGR